MAVAGNVLEFEIGQHSNSGATDAAFSGNENVGCECPFTHAREARNSDLIANFGDGSIPQGSGSSKNWAARTRAGHNCALASGTLRSRRPPARFNPQGSNLLRITFCDRTALTNRFFKCHSSSRPATVPYAAESFAPVQHPRSPVRQTLTRLGGSPTSMAPCWLCSGRGRPSPHESAHGSPSEADPAP